MTRSKNSSLAFTRLRILCVSVALVLLHISMGIFALNGGANSAFAYRKLYQGDGKHYGAIAQKGYFAHEVEWPFAWKQGSTKMMEEKTNVAFFPAYPLFAGAVLRITNLSVAQSLLFVSQFAAFIFWLYLFLLCGSFGASRKHIACAVLFLFSFPSAFFLVTSMSESVFSAALLGLLYWNRKPQLSAIPLAIVHGIVMTASRVFGMVLVPLLVLQTWLQDGTRGACARSVYIALASFLGIGGFLVYCQWAFGHADLYFAAQREGWSVHSAPLFFLHSQAYTLLFPWLTHWQEYMDGFGHIAQVALNVEGRWYTAGILWWLILWPLFEWYCHLRAYSESLRERLTFYVGALMSTYVMIVPVFLSDMQSAIRYAFVPYVFVVLMVIHWVSHTRRAHHLVQTVLFLGGVVAILGFSIELHLLRIFMLGEWVG